MVTQHKGSQVEKGLLGRAVGLERVRQAAEAGAGLCRMAQRSLWFLVFSPLWGEYGRWLH